jgi:hypothetical protein
MHPTYRNMSQVLTTCGIERSCFRAGLLLWFVVFAAFGGLSGALMGVPAFAIAAVIGYFKATNPVMIRLIMHPASIKPIYDPAMRKPFYLSIV